MSMTDPNERHDFSSIFNVHSANPEAIAAMKIIQPAFPFLRDTMGMVNIETLWRSGGTFLSNWNLTPREATCAMRVLKELQTGGHGCFFAIPIGSPSGFPDDAISEFQRITRMCMRMIIEFGDIPEFNNPKNLSKIPLPRYFSIHTFSRNPACMDAYRETAMAAVLEDIPDIAIRPDLLQAGKEFTSDYLKGFTLGSKD